MVAMTHERLPAQLASQIEEFTVITAVTCSRTTSYDRVRLEIRLESGQDGPVLRIHLLLS
jgi:hypothetical protein